MVALTKLSGVPPHSPISLAAIVLPGQYNCNANVTTLSKGIHWLRVVTSSQSMNLYTVLFTMYYVRYYSLLPTYFVNTSTSTMAVVQPRYLYGRITKENMSNILRLRLQPQASSITKPCISRRKRKRIRHDMQFYTSDIKRIRSIIDC